MEAAASYPQYLGRDYPKAPDGTLLPLAWSVGIAQIITAVPPTVLAALANPTAKASMVSAFVNGNTPAWYEQQSPEVKSYVGATGEQISAGSVNFNTQPTNTAGTGQSGSGMGGGEGAVAKGAAATSTSRLASFQLSSRRRGVYAS
jgi:hypothetical protein